MVTTTIGLISDIHATAAPLLEALKIFERESVDLVLCLGDIAGYGTELELSIELLIERDCITLLGNHDVWYLNKNIGRMEKWVESFFHNLPKTWESTVEGKKIYAVHASPPTFTSKGITLLDQFGKIMLNKKEQWRLDLEDLNFDVLIVGHTHQVFAELLGETLLINPGSTKLNNSCATLSLPEGKVQFFSLSGKTTRKIWHWGMMI